MRGSDLTQPVKFLAHDSRCLSSVANHQPRKVIDNNIALV